MMRTSPFTTRLAVTAFACAIGSFGLECLFGGCGPQSTATEQIDSDTTLEDDGSGDGSSTDAGGSDNTNGDGTRGGGTDGDDPSGTSTHPQVSVSMKANYSGGQSGRTAPLTACPTVLPGDNDSPELAAGLDCDGDGGVVAYVTPSTF